ncbi:MAG: hypothetical protein ABWZ80_03255 [Beijerinckiaceae bacterium]
MTILKKTLTAAVGAIALAGAMTLSASQAEARYWRGYGYGYGGGALAAGIIGGLALGAIAASAAQPRPVYVVGGGCYRVRRTVWSPYYGAYVTRRGTVCD